MEELSKSRRRFLKSGGPISRGGPAAIRYGRR